ncbi:hypothetical protein E2320_008150 [Naja naja]|nr:hypothetical protein E2320_008150 [Naja naja]
MGYICKGGTVSCSRGAHPSLYCPVLHWASCKEGSSRQGNGERQAQLQGKKTDRQPERLPGRVVQCSATCCSIQQSKDKSGRCLPSGTPCLLGGSLGLAARDSSEAGAQWGCLEETAPNLKGRPRKKKSCNPQRRDSFSGNKESQNNCEGKSVAKVRSSGIFPKFPLQRFRGRERQLGLLHKGHPCRVNPIMRVPGSRSPLLWVTFTASFWRGCCSQGLYLSKSDCCRAVMESKNETVRSSQKNTWHHSPSSVEPMEGLPYSSAGRSFLSP